MDHMYTCIILVTGISRVFTLINELEINRRDYINDQFQLLQCSRFIAAKENIVRGERYLKNLGVESILKLNADVWISDAEKLNCLDLEDAFLIHTEINKSIHEGIPNVIAKIIPHKLPLENRTH